MVIKRFQNVVEKTMGKRRGSTELDDIPLEGDSPESVTLRGVRNFCESNGSVEAGDEVLHLPGIVDAAESSPQAAAAAALQIRTYLSKSHYTRPQVQYNAVMLIRILADNPGASFTKNLDAKFTQTVKDLLRNSRDQSVQQIARETLSALYQQKAYDTNLTTLFAMWTKEVPNQPRPQPQQAASGRPLNAPPFAPMQQQQQPVMYPNGLTRPTATRHRSSYRSNAIPPPAELAARIEEAKTSAKLLQQLVQSTSPPELQANELIREFGQRVSAAQRSIETYINCDNPPPDEDTLQTLIETSEQLSLAASKHQRAVLQARRLVGPSTPPVHSARGDVPILGAPALPARTTSGGVPAQPPPAQWPESPRAATNYSPPPGPPPLQRVQTDDEDGLYGPPSARPAAVQPTLDPRAAPTYPPTSLGSSVDAHTAPSLPPAVVNRDPIEMPAARDDPFSDQYASPTHVQPGAPAPAPAQNQAVSPVRYDGGGQRSPPSSPRRNPTGYHVEPGYGQP